VSDVRVRFAPSPTGELHIGGARTALFNFLFVRRAGGVFVLRIDDTDLERSRTDYIDKLIASLKWLGLNWDEGPYYQSKRLEEYSKEAERLLSEGKAYRCFCSVEELEAGREEARNENRPYLYPGKCRNLSQEQEDVYIKEGRVPVIRLLTPDSGTTVVQDVIRGEVSFENSELDDLIIIKSNGLPTYNFASVVDDVQMRITHVIRAEEHLSNTPRQLLCMAALGYELPLFAHVPMILAPDRSKLSKRHGATSVEEFRGDGFLPEALVNYMALLGWSPGGDEELFSLARMAERFSLDKVNKTAAIYDTDKLTWVNSHYMREYDLDKLAEAALPYFEAKELLKSPLKGPEYDHYKKVIDMARERAKTLADLAASAVYFYSDSFSYEEKGIEKHFRKEGVAELLRKAAITLDSLEAYTRDSVDACYHELSEKLEISLGKLIHPTRLAVTGQIVGPGFFELMELLGRETVVRRMKQTADYIDSEMS
jgi:glutamyl-tRNA synthetase